MRLKNRTRSLPRHPHPRLRRCLPRQWERRQTEFRRQSGCALVGARLLHALIHCGQRAHEDCAPCLRRTASTSTICSSKPRFGISPGNWSPDDLCRSGLCRFPARRGAARSRSVWRYSATNRRSFVVRVPAEYDGRTRWASNVSGRFPSPAGGSGGRPSSAPIRWTRDQEHWRERTPIAQIHCRPRRTSGTGARGAPCRGVWSTGCGVVVHRPTQAARQAPSGRRVRAVSRRQARASSVSCS